jgi:hypothetical protein
MKRVFLLADDDLAALQRLGAALVLQWAEVPFGLREALVQQALALDWTSDPEAAAHRIRALVNSEQSASPTPSAGGDAPAT